MRVLIDCSPLVDPKRTGVGNYVYNITREMIDLFPHIRFILFGFRPLKSPDYLEEFSCKHNVEVRYTILPAKTSSVAFRLWQKVNIPNFDSMFHLNNEDSILNFDWYVPPVKKAKLFSVVFDLTWRLFPETHKVSNVELQKIRFSRIDHATGIVAISRHTYSDLIKYYPRVLQKPYRIIYPGSRTTINYSAALLKEHKYGRYILVVGTIEPRKNIDLIIESFNLSLSKNINCNLVFVGDFGWKINLKKCQNIRNVFFTGYVSDDELSDLYSNAEFCMYLPKYEGFGLPVIEALNFGKRVITFNNSSLTEAGGEYAIYLNHIDPDYISKKIVKELNRDSNNIFCSDSLQDHLNKFNYASSAKQLMDFMLLTPPIAPSS